MKKSLIVTGVASLAFAAMPIVGAFAATGSTEFTDHLKVNVNAGCTMENGGNTDGTYVDRYFEDTIATGNFKVLATSTTDGAAATNSGVITIKCNVSSGTVTVTATPENSGELRGTGYASDSNKKIAPGAVVAGSTSGWAIKSNAVNASTDPFAGTGADESVATYYVAAPTSATTFLTATASATGTTFNPSYRVYVAQGQPVDEYTGAVTYSVAYTAGS